MTLFEVVLKATRDVPLLNLTRRFPSLKMFIWCNREHDVIEVVVEDAEEYPLIIEEMRKCQILGIIEESSDGHRFYLIVHKCYCMLEDTIVRHIGTLDLLHVFPTILKNGWEYHRIIAFRHEDLEELFQRLEKWGWMFKILRKAPFDGFIASSLTLTADALFSDLTEKQIDALLTAHRHGYYKLPREADVQAIAAKKRVPRTTFQEHLKKAENKMVLALIPYVELYNHAPAAKKESLKMVKLCARASYH
ncbi:MAG: helix-turn-helix domain-containing protein [Candidatus Bathyarchaeota archaeon]|nr:helix-turn-helix domain-containing protein [Candidatus Bathyarchaeota archaeon]